MGGIVVKIRWTKLLWALPLFLLLTLAGGGCARERVSPGEGPISPGVPDIEDTGIIDLRFSTWQLESSKENLKVWVPMLQEIEARSDGRLRVEGYYGNSLGTGWEHYDIVMTGISDMGYFTATWTPDRFPLTDVLTMPVHVGGKDVAVDIGNAMYERVLHQEFQDVKILHLNGCIQSILWTREPVRTLEEAQGLRIRTPGGLQTYMIEALGAEPQFMPLGDVYEALERGLVDGVVTCSPSFYDYGLQEVAGHALTASFGCVSEGLAVNLDFWGGLPGDLQEIIEEVAGNPYRLTGGLGEGEVAEIKESLASAGVNFYHLPGTEARRWNDLFRDRVVMRWVETMEARGLPGRDTLAIYKEELDRQGVEFPAYP